MPRITPNLWFDTEGEEAAEFYVSVFPNSKITTVTYYSEAGPRPAGTVLTVDFVLDGQEYTAINGGPQFTFDEAISLAHQLRRPGGDRLLLGRSSPRAARRASAGGSRTSSACRGRSCPAGWAEPAERPRPGARRRGPWPRMLGMQKIDIAAIEAAADGA